MNPRLELYVSGATLADRYVIQHKTGKRVAVLDPAKRTRAAIVQMLLGGMKPREVARALDLPLGTVCALGIAGLRKKRSLKISL